jgi:hypothetical protein
MKNRELIPKIILYFLDSLKNKNNLFIKLISNLLLNMDKSLEN